MKEMILMQMAVDYPPTVSRNDVLANEIRRDRLASKHSEPMLHRVKSLFQRGQTAFTSQTIAVAKTTQEIACATC